jgi:predicted double-glycine peptidase
MRKILWLIVLFTTLVAFILAFNFPFDHPPQYEIDGISYIQQPDQITCGPTSLTMLLHRYGKDVELADVKAQTKTQWFTYDNKPVGMTSPEYISVAMNKLGVRARMIQGNMNQLKYFVSKRRPPIVLLRSGQLTWHYVLVIGYNENSIIIADPASGEREIMPNEAFMGAWNFKTDMRGREAGHPSLVLLLRMSEVYPKTMIVPWHSVD